MHRLAITCTLLAAGAIPACTRNDRPAVVPVEGQVYYRDQPVAGARVTFLNADAPRAATGETDQAGHFRLSTFEPNDGAVPGTHAVTVVKPPANAPAATTDLEGRNTSRPCNKSSAVPAARRNRIRRSPPSTPVRKPAD